MQRAVRPDSRRPFWLPFAGMTVESRHSGNSKYAELRPFAGGSRLGTPAGGHLSQVRGVPSLFQSPGCLPPSFPFLGPSLLGRVAPGGPGWPLPPPSVLFPWCPCCLTLGCTLFPLDLALGRGAARARSVLLGGMVGTRSKVSQGWWCLLHDRCASASVHVACTRDEGVCPCVCVSVEGGGLYLCGSHGFPLVNP